MEHRNLRTLTSDDLYGLKLVSEPQFAPDGASIAYVVTTIEREHNDYRSSIYVTTTDGTQRRLTRADAKDGAPRWSPNGEWIAFTSNRSGKGQVWLLPAAGGEATQLTSLSEGAGSVAWLPDSSGMIVVSKSTEAGEQEAKDAEKNGGKQDEKSDVRRITHIRYRFDGMGYLDHKAENLWRVSVADGAAKQLTTVDAQNQDPVVSPDGQWIAFVSDRTDDREVHPASEIWVVGVDGRNERCLFGGELSNIESPSWSPDSQSVAAVGNRLGNRSGVHVHAWLLPLDGSEPKNLTEGYDRSISDAGMSDVYASSVTRLNWAPDGSGLYAPIADSGSTNVQRIDTATGEVSAVTRGARRISAMSLSADGTQIAYVSGHATNPGDLYIANADGSGERQLTTANADFLGGISLSEPEEFTVKSQSGDPDIHGWVLKPPSFDPSKKYPLILQIHGGPAGMYSNAMMHEFQLMAARGYVVVYSNPRGSSGYGEDFLSCNRANWGEGDMPDVMAAFEHIAEQDYIDQNRLGVTGGSYGGYLTLWIVGHTDRFHAAVTQRCVSNFYSFYGTSDIGFTFGEDQFGGLPWSDRDLLMKHSPITYVDKMVTPLLIVHSEEDWRCPIEQGEQVFVSLKRLGRDVEMVRFSGEGHNLSRTGKPENRKSRLEAIIGWFDSHL